METTSECDKFLNEIKQTVFVRGTEVIEYPWKSSNEKNGYCRACGLIISHGEEKYVVSHRGSFQCCKEINMYYPCYDACDTEPYAAIRNRLEILFQTVEFDLIIFGTYECSKLDITKSKPVYYDRKLDMCEINRSCPSFSIDQCSFIVPNKLSTYYLIKFIGLPCEDGRYYNKLFFRTRVYETKYIGIYQGYDCTVALRDAFLYHFRISYDRKLEDSIFHGSAIYDNEHHLIGICCGYEDHDLAVLPLKAIYKVCNDFFNYRNRQDQYCGFLIFPDFKYQTIHTNRKCGNRAIEILSNIQASANGRRNDITKGDIILGKGDIILGIDGMSLKICEEEFFIHDDQCDVDLPPNKYAIMNFESNKPIYLKVLKSGKIEYYKINGVPTMRNLYNIPLTIYPYFGTKKDNLFVRIKGITITVLTAELLMSLVCNDYKPYNRFINGHCDGDDQSNSYLIIVTCTNKSLRRKYKLPDFNNKGSIYFPPVISVNGRRDITLEDLAILKKESKEFTITIERSDGNKCNIHL
jgi:hypothetical protein